MEIHIAHNGQRLGPFSLAEVQGKIDASELQRTDLAWTDGKPDWVSLEKIEGLVWPGPPAIPVPGLPPAQMRSPVPLNAGPYPAPNPRPTSGLAITSLITGILSITFVVPLISSIVAIVTGHMARAEIKRTNGSLGGDGMAVAGLVTGYGGLGIIVAGFAILLIFGLGVIAAFFAAGANPVTSPNHSALEHGYRVAAACRSYAANHKGAFPDQLDDLVPQYLSDPEALTSKFAPKEKAVQFQYNGGRDSDPGSKVLFYSPNTDIAGKHVVGHVNGHVGLELLPLPSEVEKDDKRR
jgi:hypothetical protein